MLETSVIEKPMNNLFINVTGDMLVTTNVRPPSRSVLAINWGMFVIKFGMLLIFKKLRKTTDEITMDVLVNQEVISWISSKEYRHLSMWFKMHHYHAQRLQCLIIRRIAIDIVRFWIVSWIWLDQVVELNSGTTIDIVCSTQPIPCLLMLWWLQKPVHQQAWYWSPRPASPAS